MKKRISKGIYEKMTQGSMGGRRLMLVNICVVKTFLKLVNEPGLSLILFNCRVKSVDMKNIVDLIKSKVELIRYIGLFDCTPKQNILQPTGETHVPISFVRPSSKTSYTKHAWLKHLKSKPISIPYLHVDRTFTYYLSSHYEGQPITIENMIVNLYNEESHNIRSLAQTTNDTIEHSKIIRERELYKVANVEVHVILKDLRMQNLMTFYIFLVICSLLHTSSTTSRTPWP